MPKQAKLTYDLVAKTIDNLIKNKANGEKFPTFMQIIKITGGNANTLNSYIKQYKELQAKNTNSQIEVLQQQLKKYADTNAKYVNDFTGLNTKIDILTNKNIELQNKNIELQNKNIELQNKNVELQKENQLLKNENANLKTQIKNNNAYDTLLNLLKTHSADFKRFEKKFDDINNITILNLQKDAYDNL